MPFQNIISFKSSNNNHDNDDSIKIIEANENSPERETSPTGKNY